MLKTRNLLTAAAAGLVMMAGTANAATIVYSFDGGSTAATSNDFGGSVTAVDAQTTGGVVIGANIITGGWSSTYGSDHASVKLQQNGTLSFVVDIPDGVIVDLTNLTFDFNHESTNPSGNTQVRNDWTLAISTGSASPSTGSLQDLSGVGSVETTPSVALSGLTGLSDTEVTFTFTLETGVNNGIGGGNADDRRLVVDDIILTGSVVPEPGSLALLGLGGLLIARRRRND